MARKVEEGSLEAAAQKAYNLLLSMRTACAERARLVLKELLQQCVRRITVTFRARKQGKRVIHVPVRGVLELYTLRGLVTDSTSRLSRGDPLEPLGNTLRFTMEDLRGQRQTA